MVSMDPSGDRSIDANLNRAAEGLRVVEDLCRFHWELAGMAGELKGLRHELLNVFLPGPGSRGRLSSGRDSEEDVGREIAVASPRPDAEAVAVRNLQRAKEAFRVLEEVGRIRDTALAARVSALRYRLYSIEKGILALCSRRPDAMARAHLCLLASRERLGIPLLEAVRAAIAGGVDAVQLREKGAPDREVLEIGRALREATAREGIPFIVNDRPDLAVILGADGVHVGQDDVPVTAARGILGDGRLVGVSTHAADQARRAERDGADYLGAGPAFATTTKQVGAPLGPEGVAAILRATDLPAFAIGGISPQNIGSLAAAGVRRVAVASGILLAGGPGEIREAARAIRSALG